MKNAIILHGTCDREEYYSEQFPSASNSHWIPWLQKQLLIRDIAASTPEMPNSYQPNYAVWCREFERFTVNVETILVGHSCGAGFLVRWLSEQRSLKVGKVVLVAPWLDPDKTKGADNGFFSFEIDSDLVLRTKGLIIFNSSNDSADVQKSVKQISSNISGVKIVEFKNYGHFCLSDMGTESFPELLTEAIS